METQKQQQKTRYSVTLMIEGSKLESYLTGRRKEIPQPEGDEEEPGNRRTPEYIVTLRIKASTLPAVEKKAKEVWGEKFVRADKVGRGFSRAQPRTTTLAGTIHIILWRMEWGR